MNIEKTISQHCKAHTIERAETLQTLWSGYGEIVRYKLYQQNGNPCPTPTIIAKSIKPPAHGQSNHPRGWNTTQSHTRKIQSYKVESHWYSQWAQQCQAPFTVPTCYASLQHNNQQLILLEDLDAQGYTARHQQLSPAKSQACLKWLAHFHACFMVDTQTTAPGWVKDLWPTGCYWHLHTRQDEWHAMAEGKLKSQAAAIDKALTTSRYQTLVHGDAKVANFCFNDSNNRVAAVDFQYIGAGSGVKDVVYFIGSCLSERDCQRAYPELINYYFDELQQALRPKHNFNAQLIEQQWRHLLPFAWADFQRFILGWMPSHTKNNDFSQYMTEQALQQL